MSEELKYVEHYIGIDLYSKKVSTQDDGGTINIQTANYGHRLHIKLYEGAKEYILPTDASIVQLAFQKPSGVKSDCLATIDEDNYVVVVMPVVALDIAGKVRCEVRIVLNDGTWVSSPVFDVFVNRSIYDPNTMQELSAEPTAYETILASEIERQENEAARENAEQRRSEAFESMIGEMEEYQISDNYNTLNNKPTINGVPVEGDKSLQDYHLDDTFEEIGNMALLSIIQQYFN